MDDALCQIGFSGTHGAMEVHVAGFWAPRPGYRVHAKVFNRPVAPFEGNHVPFGIVFILPPLDT
jgi:hypothetical protein